VALKNRHSPPEVVAPRLARASPADRLSKALTAYGRIFKAIYILRYITKNLCDAASKFS
jgi:TnpA family transposase